MRGASLWRLSMAGITIRPTSWPASVWVSLPAQSVGGCSPGTPSLLGRSSLGFLGAAQQYAVEQELERGVWLAAERDLRAEQKDLARTQCCFGYSNAAIQILLTPRPSAMQGGSVCEPSYRVSSFESRIRLQSKHRAAVEEYIHLVRHAIRNRAGIVDAGRQEGPRNVELFGGQRSRLAVCCLLNQSAADR